jgi:mono/diheme cytochrome c family protein
MPSWGVASGKGILNEQGVEDLVNYIQSIQISPKEAVAISTEAVPEYRQGAKDVVEAAEKAVTDAEKALTDAHANPDTNAAELTKAETDLEKTRAQLEKANAYAAEVAGLSDGAILFRLNCARCHTKGWSYYDPTSLDVPPPAPQGSGAYGPSLRDGSTLLQFPGRAGVQEQFSWVANGTDPVANQQYGARGISSGRMPHFGKQLTEAQIKLIVAYERSL